MDQSLRDAAEQGSIDALYALIRTNADVLDSMDKIPFVDTPLHIAASLGHTHFAMEIMKLKPSLARKLNQDGFSPMHLALQNNQTQLVRRLLDVDKDLVRVQGREGMTPLHYVAQTGNLYLLAEFRKVCPMSIKDVTIQRKTALHIALNNNQLDAFELFIRWLQWTTVEDASLWKKKLLNWKDEEGQTVLHIAVEKTLPHVVRWLLDARVDANTMNLAGLTALDILEGQTQIDNSEHIIIRNMLCRPGGALSASSLPRVRSDESLRDAVEQGNIDDLYLLIGRDAKVWDWFDEIPFVETPLHTAAFAGHTRFAMEVMKLKPSFARKLNQDGFSPMHLALQRLHELEENPDLRRNQAQLVDRLLDVDKDLVRVHGREGVTPLHYVVQTGNLDLLAKFLEVCPESSKDVTIQKENVLHIALKNDRVEAFLHVIEWVQRTWSVKDAILLEKELLCGRDEKGNTLLHTAVSRKLDEVVSPLLDTGLVDLNAKNLKDQTVFNILEDQTNKADDILEDQREKEKKLRIIKNKLQQRPLGLILSTFLSSPFQFLEWEYVTMRRAHTLITDERLNALLVVGALLITVTFQASLTPPKSRQNLFHLFNSIAYCLTTVSLFALIPPFLLGFVLHVLLLLLFACFCVSTLVATTHHKIFIGLSFLFGYIFSTLVLYLVLLNIPVNKFQIPSPIKIANTVNEKAITVYKKARPCAASLSNA